jgi:dolichol-phosphate mannosyltransferase
MNKTNVSIVCPVYKEQEIIEDFYNELKKSENNSNYQIIKIIFVIDPSNDKTYDILKNISTQNQKVEVILLSRRFGHQNSLFCGIKQVKNSQATIMMDSDLQHPPYIINELVKKFQQGYDIVNTKRLFSNDVNFLDRFTSNIFYKFFRNTTKLPLQQYNADFRLISENVRKKIIENFLENRIFLRGIISWIGFDQAYVEYKANERSKGKSKFGTFSRLTFGFNSVFNFSAFPINISIYVGIFFSFLAFLIGIYHTIIFFLFENIPDGWTTLVTLLTFFSGLIILFLGVIGKYISLIFDEVKKRPLYIIKNHHNKE